MTILSQEYRKRAAYNRAEADDTSLPNARARLLHSAKRLDELAEQAERSQTARAERP